MAERIRLYVSVTRDLELEREVVGQVVATLPLELGWQIDITPASGAPLKLEAVQRADLYVCLLGADATAPVGAEWSWAQRAGTSTLAYRKEVHRSPSAAHFLRASPGVWTPFADAHDLRRRLRPDLAQRLIDRATALGLHLNEVETLSALIDDESAQPGAEPAEDRWRGAGKGGVILGREGPEEP